MVARTVATELLPTATITLLRAALSTSGEAISLSYHWSVNPFKGKVRVTFELKENRNRIPIGR